MRAFISKPGGKVSCVMRCSCCWYFPLRKEDDMLVFLFHKNIKIRIYYEAIETLSDYNGYRLEDWNIPFFSSPSGTNQGRHGGAYKPFASFRIHHTKNLESPGIDDHKGTRCIHGRRCARRTAASCSGRTRHYSVVG